MTDNGACYRSRAFADALGQAVKHKWTKPYRPQTNGKVERFNRILTEEWAYARPYASESERVAAHEPLLHTCNHHRGHTALKGASPGRPRTQPGGAVHLVPWATPVCSPAPHQEQDGCCGRRVGW